MKLLQPMRFAHDRFKVRVDVPTEEVVMEIDDAATPAKSLPSDEVAEFKRLTEILFGGEYRYIQGTSDDDILREELSKKYA